MHFSEQEWALLNVNERALYKDVMQENYKHILSLGKYYASCCLLYY